MDAGRLGGVYHVENETSLQAAPGVRAQDLGPERLGPTVADMMIAPGFDVVGIPPKRERETNAIPPKADYRIATMCRLLGVSSSGYRARVKRRPSRPAANADQVRA